jgi:hypothetical protein
MMMKRAASLLWLGVALPALACAAGTHIQESAMVTGTITVNPDGSVQSYTVDDLDKLLPAARQIIQATVPHWQFVPIVDGGKTVTAKAGMSLRIVMDWQSIHAKQATIRVAGAAFGCEARPKSQLPGECPKDMTVMPESRFPPRYPLEALRAGIGG